MSLSLSSLLKESLTIGHGLSAVAGAYLHKLFAKVKAGAKVAEADAKKVVADIKKDL